MVVAKITKEEFWELEGLRMQLDNSDNATLCKCPKCGGYGWADKSLEFDENNFCKKIKCPGCDVNVQKIDKIEIV